MVGRLLLAVPWGCLQFAILEANKLYDRANYIKQHFLQGVMFNISLLLISILRSTVKDILSNIPFINKGMEFNDLHSIFKNKLVILSIPNYFNNSETPIICYIYIYTGWVVTWFLLGYTVRKNGGLLSTPMF